MLLQMLVEHPLLFPAFPQHLTKGSQIASTRQHSVSRVKAVGQRYETADLSAEARNVLLAAWNGTPVVPIPLRGVSGLAGVVNGRSIHFQHLSNLC